MRPDALPIEQCGYARIYKYGDTYKVVWSYPTGGREHKDKPQQLDESKGKLDNNISRAKARITEFALCNDWQYFVTLTLSEEKQDRFDLKGYIKRLGEWIGNYNKKYCTKLKYIIVPERHPTSGAWHAHGLLNGVADASLIRNEYGYLDMPYYKQRFGYISMSAIKDKRRVARYVTKYVSKEICERMDEFGAHLFYASHGLAERECLGQFTDIVQPADIWRNEFCAIKWYDDLEGVSHLFEMPD